MICYDIYIYIYIYIYITRERERERERETPHTCTWYHSKLRPQARAVAEQAGRGGQEVYSGCTIVMPLKRRTGAEDCKFLPQHYILYYCITYTQLYTLLYNITVYNIITYDIHVYSCVSLSLYLSLYIYIYI